MADDSDDEDLRRVLEMSMMETGGGQRTSSQTEEGEDEDFKRAMELSLIPQPKFANKEEGGNDSEEELQEALRLSMIDNDDDSQEIEAIQVKTPEVSLHDQSESGDGDINDRTIDLTNSTHKAETVNISSDELFGAGPSSTMTQSTSWKSKPVTAPLINIDDDSDDELRRVLEMSLMETQHTSIMPGRPIEVFKPVDVPLINIDDEDSHEEEDSDDEFRRVMKMSLMESRGGPGMSSLTEYEMEMDLKRAMKLSLNYQPKQPALSTEEATSRMRNVFESGLAIHFSGEEMQACKAVTTTLFPHQRVALAWMFRHENKETDGTRGGILADDMGLGKTLTVISLIMTNHWDGKPLTRPKQGYTRPSLNIERRVVKGKGKVGGAFWPKGSNGNSGAGIKEWAKVEKKKTSIEGLFDKFHESSDSESEKENKEDNVIKQRKLKTSKAHKMSDSSGSDAEKEFNYEKSKLRTNKVHSYKEANPFSDTSSESDDDFVRCKEVIDKRLQKPKTVDNDEVKEEDNLADKIEEVADDGNLLKEDIDKRLLKPNLYKTLDNDEVKEEDNLADKIEEGADDGNMLKEKPTIPTVLSETCKFDFDSNLNVDGLLDAPSSDSNPDSEEETSTTFYREQQKKRKLNMVESLQNQQPQKKIKLIEDTPFDTGTEESTLSDFAKGEPSKLRVETTKIQDPEKARMNEETGLKLLIPPEDPAVRDGRRRATLLVCPTSLISHWVEQLQQHLHKNVNLKLKVHHGSKKAQTGAELERHDIVITTYGTLAAEWGAARGRPLSKAKWLRVVLDEGHMIKNHISKSAKACLGLDTLRKWIVTGTPIQNNLMELWSLVNWLEFGLYAGKNKMRVFKQQIEGPCKKGIRSGFERLQMLMDAICLRRTKTDRKPDGSPLVPLPSKKIITREVVMSEEDRLCYSIYYKKAQQIVGRYQANGQLLRNYAHVLALMTRLRQLCCHRELIKEVDWAEALKDKEALLRQLEGYLDKDEIHPTGDDADIGLDDDTKMNLVKQLREMIKSGVSDDCSVCLDDLHAPVITPCAHVFCRACIERVLETIKPPCCPLCRTEIVNKKQLVEAGQDDEGEEQSDSTMAAMEDLEVNVSSSKVNAVLKEMLRIQRDFPDDKIIVVSQFTSFMSILQPLIRQANFSLVRLDGSMSHMDRSEVVTQFQSDKQNSPNVLLLSLKAGGVGLNLTAANHLLLLDPAWNPASEWQCFDRTHRLGQKKNVNIYKYITKDSIEEKMLEIQDKKKDLISGAFHMPADERRQQRVEDIRNIFGI